MRRIQDPPAAALIDTRSGASSGAEETTLAHLPDGGEAEVVDLRCTGQIRRRLLDLGLVPGTRVRRRMTAAGGDPAAYEVRGSVVALRLSTARQISARVVPGASASLSGDPRPDAPPPARGAARALFRPRSRR